MGKVGDTTLLDEKGQIITPGKELTQIDIQNLLDSINEALSGLKFLSNVKGVAADLRVTLLSGVVTTVSTVTTVTTVGTVTTVTTVATVTSVTNIVNLGGVPANQLVPSNQNILVQLGNTANTSGY